jgi:type III secretion HrpO family protein
MTEALVLDYAMKCMVLVLLLSLPPILVATVLGLLVSLFQALTQIQEQTLSFAIKLVAVVATLVLTARWLGIELVNYTVNILDTFPTAVP